MYPREVVALIGDNGAGRTAEAFDALGVGIPSTSAAVANFSGGQRQGVAVSRAVTWANRVVFMDEPTTALGVVQTRKVLDLIRRVRDQGISVVLISHNMPEVLEVSDRIEVLRLGRRVARIRKEDATMEGLVGAMTVRPLLVRQLELADEPVQVSALPASSWAEAAICSVEAQVSSVEAETCSVDAEDSSATAATSLMLSCMLVARAVICWAAAAICSIRAVMSSTEAADLQERLAGLLDDARRPRCACAPVLDDLHGLRRLVLDRADQP